MQPWILYWLSIALLLHSIYRLCMHFSFHVYFISVFFHWVSLEKPNKNQYIAIWYLSSRVVNRVLMPKWLATLTMLLGKPFKNQAKINEIELLGGYEAW